ncbi:hypothetical protein, partial [Hydrocoleum sp. CS-953]|uniref:hypothetical protein n=1 Tax=Hydrocoleum sp. CS-953 TaxID=1671698 RepID=UPI001AEF64FF
NVSSIQNNLIIWEFGDDGQFFPEFSLLAQKIFPKTFYCVLYAVFISFAIFPNNSTKKKRILCTIYCVYQLCHFCK